MVALSQSHYRATSTIHQSTLNTMSVFGDIAIMLDSTIQSRSTVDEEHVTQNITSQAM